jgi:hypothetical protein
VAHLADDDLGEKPETLTLIAFLLSTAGGTMATRHTMASETMATRMTCSPVCMCSERTAEISVRPTSNFSIFV